MKNGGKNKSVVFIILFSVLKQNSADECSLVSHTVSLKH